MVVVKLAPTNSRNDGMNNVLRIIKYAKRALAYP